MGSEEDAIINKLDALFEGLEACLPNEPLNDCNCYKCKNSSGILNKRYKVLDHGFVSLIDYMGTDKSIVNSARVSYGACHKFHNGTDDSSEITEKDRKLIKRLYQDEHLSPFEMCELKFHIKLPIFVARQWIRHRTASVNEISARYTTVYEEFYIPEKIRGQSSSNKQCSGDLLPEGNADFARQEIERISRDAYNAYQTLLAEGVSRETARIVLPLNFYTQWIWKMDLRNLLHFLTLRNSPDAQFEIACYAKTIESIVEKIYPELYVVFSGESDR